MVWNSILGLFLLAFGTFMIVLFPDIQDYQSEKFTRAGISIGFLALVLGVYLLTQI